ncbi:unnamed protein product [Vitrella brassicaformis CCMP3155]|uniref:Uncharacterized protein n=4 Tax=Vitrella brassicaformis TaxID=1169539 RepID=A0A0G4FXI2_VITBC|nr:unnamed protein product [Vitrella brassicaformis CCMP3155]|eukprot:CEM20119.1 unnamed protein product [Vitrella brassicaformis CCMP3155]
MAALSDPFAYICGLLCRHEFVQTGEPTRTAWGGGMRVLDSFFLTPDGEVADVYLFTGCRGKKHEDEGAPVRSWLGAASYLQTKSADRPARFVPFPTSPAAAQQDEDLDVGMEKPASFFIAWGRKAPVRRPSTAQRPSTAGLTSGAMVRPVVPSPCPASVYQTSVHPLTKSELHKMVELKMFEGLKMLQPYVDVKGGGVFRALYRRKQPTSRAPSPTTKRKGRPPPTPLPDALGSTCNIWRTFWDVPPAPPRQQPDFGLSRAQVGGHDGDAGGAGGHDAEAGAGVVRTFETVSSRAQHRSLEIRSPELNGLLRSLMHQLVLFVQHAGLMEVFELDVEFAIDKNRRVWLSYAHTCIAKRKKKRPRRPRSASDIESQWRTQDRPTKMALMQKIVVAPWRTTRGACALCDRPASTITAPKGLAQAAAAPPPPVDDGTLSLPQRKGVKVADSARQSHVEEAPEEVLQDILPSSNTPEHWMLVHRTLKRIKNAEKCWFDPRPFREALVRVPYKDVLENVLLPSVKPSRIRSSIRSSIRSLTDKGTQSKRVSTLSRESSFAEVISEGLGDREWRRFRYLESAMKPVLMCPNCWSMMERFRSIKQRAQAQIERTSRPSPPRERPPSPFNRLKKVLQSTAPSASTLIQESIRDRRKSSIRKKGILASFAFKSLPSDEDLPVPGTPEGPGQAGVSVRLPTPSSDDAATDTIGEEAMRECLSPREEEVVMKKKKPVLRKPMYDLEDPWDEMENRPLRRPQSSPSRFLHTRQAIAGDYIRRGIKRVLPDQPDRLEADQRYTVQSPSSQSSAHSSEGEGSPVFGYREGSEPEESVTQSEGSAAHVVEETQEVPAEERPTQEQPLAISEEPVQNDEEPPEDELEACAMLEMLDSPQMRTLSYRSQRRSVRSKTLPNRSPENQQQQQPSRLSRLGAALSRTVRGGKSQPQPLVKDEDGALQATSAERKQETAAAGENANVHEAVSGESPAEADGGFQLETSPDEARASAEDIQAPQGLADDHEAPTEERREDFLPTETPEAAESVAPAVTRPSESLTLPIPSIAQTSITPISDTPLPTLVRSHLDQIYRTALHRVLIEPASLESVPRDLYTIKEEEIQRRADEQDMLTADPPASLCRYFSLDVIEEEKTESEVEKEPQEGARQRWNRLLQNVAFARSATFDASKHSTIESVHQTNLLQATEGLLDLIKAFKAKDMEGRGELSKVIVRAIIRKQLPKQLRQYLIHEHEDIFGGDPNDLISLAQFTAIISQAIHGGGSRVQSPIALDLQEAKQERLRSMRPFRAVQYGKRPPRKIDTAEFGLPESAFFPPGWGGAQPVSTRMSTAQFGGSGVTSRRSSFRSGASGQSVGGGAGSNSASRDSLKDIYKSRLVEFVKAKSDGLASVSAVGERREARAELRKRLSH